MRFRPGAGTPRCWSSLSRRCLPVVVLVPWRFISTGSLSITLPLSLVTTATVMPPATPPPPEPGSLASLLRQTEAIVVSAPARLLLPSARVNAEVVVVRHTAGSVVESGWVVPSSRGIQYSPPNPQRARRRSTQAPRAGPRPRHTADHAEHDSRADTDPAVAFLVVLRAELQAS